LNLKRMLAEFLDRPGIKARLRPGYKVLSHQVWPLDSAAHKGVRRVFNGALMIGDAAALIDPFDGGGIPNAFISARLASAVVHNALVGGEVNLGSLAVFDELCQKVIVRRMRGRYRQARFLSSFPLILDWILVAAGRIQWLAQKYEAKYYDLSPLCREVLQAMKEPRP